MVRFSPSWSQGNCCRCHCWRVWIEPSCFYGPVSHVSLLEEIRKRDLSFYWAFVLSLTLVDLNFPRLDPPIGILGHGPLIASVWMTMKVIYLPYSCYFYIWPGRCNHCNLAHTDNMKIALLVWVFRAVLCDTCCCLIYYIDVSKVSSLNTIIYNCLISTLSSKLYIPTKPGCLSWTQSWHCVQV